VLLLRGQQGLACVGADSGRHATAAGARGLKLKPRARLKFFFLQRRQRRSSAASLACAGAARAAPF
jgi:hypothetical protein